MSKMNRRDFLKASILAGTGVALAACAPASTQPAQQGNAPTSSQPLELTLWQSDWGKDYNEPMVTLADNYKKDVAPNVTVKMTFLPNLSEKMVSAITAGNPPDCMLIDEGYGIPKLAIQGGLISMKPYFEKAGVKKEDFIPFTWETVLFKGEPFGIPGGAGSILMMINRDAYKDAGIDPTSIPKIPTWAQFKEWSSKLYKKDANGKIIRIGHDPLGQWAQFRGIFNFQVYDTNKTKLAINSPASVASLTEWFTLLPTDVNYADITSAQSGAPGNMYGAWMAGIRGMEEDDYWMFLAIDKYAPKMDYFVNYLPTMNGKEAEQTGYTGWVWDMAIPKGSPHPEDAWGFIKYGYYDKAEMLADTINWPSKISAFPEFEKRTIAMMGQNNRLTPYMPLFALPKQVGAWFEPWTPIYSKLGDQFGTAMQSIARREKTAQQAMDEVVATLQPELDKAQGTF
jgi:ABC-type glycerol-3-phosphate transport system substrate-binding protein